MANKTEELNVDLSIKQVASDAVLKAMEENNQLGANEVIFTKTDTEVPMMPVGSIFASVIPQTDARVHLLDGSTISQKGVYETFANLIKALDASGQPITYKDDNQSTANDKFNNDVSKTGNCGKFIIDDKNGTIRLPKITTFIQGLSNISNIGKSLEAGLPSITHTHPQYITANSGPYMGRQDYTADRSSSDIYPHVDTGTNSAVSPIYGKSNTVQPNATQFPYYIVLASGYKSSQVVNVDNIMAEVNSKTTLLEAYPVGSIYMSTNSTSPAQRFGGTWEQLKDRFLLGAGGSYSNGSTGGYTDSIVVAHSHTQIYVANYYLTAWTGGSGLSTVNLTGGSTSSDGRNMFGTNVVGSSGTGRNIPPYLAVYMWKRVA